MLGHELFHVVALAPAARLTDDSERSPANVDGMALPPLMAADGWLPFQSACVLGSGTRVTAKQHDERGRLQHGIRKLLKEFGVTAQREIERAVRQAAAEHRLDGSERLPTTLTLSIPTVGLTHTIEGDIDLG